MDDKTSLTQLTALVQEELARLRSRAGALPGRQNAVAPLPEIAEASERARLRALRSALRVAATLLDQPDPAGFDAMKAELAALENELQSWRSSSRSWTEEVLGAVERWVAPAGATILVVDDYADAREIMRVRLAAAGHRVLEAANGLEALAVIRERHPDLVLLDLMMPKMDGFEVLQRLREDPAISATPVIVLTAQVLSETELARLNRSVTTVLEKGVFRAEEVLSQVGAVLAGQHKLGGPTQRVVRAAMAYIHEHYGERLTREAIAAQVAVGARHLTRAFQQELGMSPMTYLMRYRVHQARRLLAAQYMSVAEVAEAVGFSNEFHFNRLFRREVGVTPGAYRRGARSEG